MNQKIAGLAAIAVMMLALLFHFQGEEGLAEQSLFLPELTGALADVSEIQVRSLNDGAEVTIRRQEKIWTIVEKDGYPADFAVLAKFLNQLKGLEIEELKTSIKENHSRLDVADSGLGAGTQVKILPLGLAFIVGKDGAIRGSFVRRDGESQVYLTHQTIHADPDGMAWIDPVAINIDPASVVSVSIAQRDASFLRASRDETSGAMILKDIPAGRALRFETVVDGLSRSLLNLRFTDVMPFDEALFANSGVMKLSTLEGEVISVTSVEVQGRFLVHIVTPTLSGWQFEVSDYHYGELNKTLENLLKPEIAESELGAGNE
ncbi:MAG: hypothetical protein ACI8Z1_001453 [Candidatus Azotimanducaceae bacterium]|jgi:hypothetical protein